jgi:prevent-host-death family protein
MTTVGVRELRQRASDLLRRVEHGETIEITDRGRPVALLTPVPEVSGLQRMRAAGDIDPATEDPANLPALIDLPSGAESPSTVLARLRRDER